MFTDNNTISVACDNSPTGNGSAKTEQIFWL